MTREFEVKWCMTLALHVRSVTFAIMTAQILPKIPKGYRDICEQIPTTPMILLSGRIATEHLASVNH